MDITQYLEEINKLEQAEFRGWCHCLESIRASLEMYPNGGGDIEIMNQLERLIREDPKGLRNGL